MQYNVYYPLWELFEKREEKFRQQRWGNSLAVTYEQILPIIHNVTTVVYNPL
jgi:1,2-phenylacetyl-CoA epoxidase PaaB subunit